MKIDYICPFCKEDAEISVSYESPSDYYAEGYECGNCGKELDHNIVDDLAYDGTADWLGDKIDRAMDYERDKLII